LDIYTLECIFMQRHASKGYKPHVDSLFRRRPCVHRAACAHTTNDDPKDKLAMKQLRHAAIRDLLVRMTVANQDDLRRKLAGKGFHVTQATLSRDIHELKLSKGPSGYSIPVDEDEDDDELPEIQGVLESWGLEVRQAQNLLVVIARTGGAQPIAAGLDYEDWPEIVGTVAGDDTVLVICPDEQLAGTVRARIEDYIG
jgi:transcriptional regulator of arginine metabolism